VAWDPIAQAARWRVDLPVVNSGGVLTTAGNLVFQGRSDGRFVAYRATDGTVLWEFDAGTGIMAPPVTFEVDGTQHLTLMVGWGGDQGLINPSRIGPVKPGFGRIMTFTLGATTPFAAPPFQRGGSSAPPPRLGASPAVLASGRQLYDTHCFGCHGVGAIAGALPDLRYASEFVHQEFEHIVLGGTRAPLGMPSFGDLLSPPEVQAIRAYVIERAHDTAR
jgi:quinohemoprotein ethanol dehydrogenase